MTPRLRSTLFLCAFVFAGFSQSKDDVEPGLPLQLGDYLTVEYIDLLRQTRSPMAAGLNSDHRQYIKAEFDANERLIGFTLMGSFHEGLGGIVADTSLNIIREEFGERVPSKLKALSRSEFFIAVEGKTLIYRYVGDLKKYIARNTVVGKYKDNKGGLYTFSEEGVATFPGRSFEYEVPTDLMIGFDQIYETGKNGAAYGFKVVNNELQLFKIVGEFVDEPEPNPFVTLTRIVDTEAKP